jgi:hypothetical protein
VQNGKKILREILGRIQFHCDAAKAKIEDAGAPGTLFSEDSIGIGTGHGDALGLTLNGEGL